MIDRPVLAFDCSAAACSVAVVTTGGSDGIVALARRAQTMHRGHAAALAPMIEAALADAGVRPAELGLIAVTVGPGSFTGVRIALAMARGLAVALGVPLAGLTTIETLVAGTTATDRQRLQTERRRLAAAIDTHRGDYYVGFDDAQTPFVADATSVAGRASGNPLLLIGDGAASLCEAMVRAGLDAAPAAGPATPDPVVLARLALARGAGGWRTANARDGMPRPLYLRPADTSVPRPTG